MANLFESPPREVSKGHLKAVWRDLGRATGSVTVGLRRIEIAPGHFSTPAHEHGGDEEIFFVLAGSGLLWQEGEVFEVAAGDTLVHVPGTGAHTLRGGDEGLDVLVFGERRDGKLTALPRAGVAWSFPRWVEMPGGDSPYAREVQAGPPDCSTAGAARPANVVALEDVEAIFGGIARRVGRAAGALATGLNHVRLPPGRGGAPAHCHSAEEEMFVVLEGSCTLELWPRGAQEPEEHPLSAGDMICRPAGTGVAHALRAGADGVTYLAYGTREQNDMCFYPQSGRVSLRGLGIALTAPAIEHLPDL